MHDMFRTLQMAMAAEDKFLTGTEIVNLAVDWSTAGDQMGGGDWGKLARVCIFVEKSNAIPILILIPLPRLAFGTKPPELVCGNGHFRGPPKSIRFVDGHQKGKSEGHRRGVERPPRLFG
jgi:hypothetical protein